jgi:hypothetical protein
MERFHGSVSNSSCGGIIETGILFCAPATSLPVSLLKSLATCTQRDRATNGGFGSQKYRHREILFFLFHQGSLGSAAAGTEHKSFSLDEKVEEARMTKDR